MSREQNPLTAQLKITPTVDVIKVLDYLRVQKDGSKKSYTLVIEDLLEESISFIKIKELQEKLETQRVLNHLQSQSTSIEDFSFFDEMIKSN